MTYKMEYQWKICLDTDEIVMSLVEYVSTYGRTYVCRRLVPQRGTDCTFNSVFCKLHLGSRGR